MQSNFTPKNTEETEGPVLETGAESTFTDIIYGIYTFFY